MAQTDNVLIDASESVVREGTVAEGRAGGMPWHVRLQTLHGGRSEGAQVVELDNGAMCIDVLPTRGMGIWRVRRMHLSPNPSPSRGGERSLGGFASSRGGERADTAHTLGWQAPAREPVHPAFVPLMEPGGLGWLDGFNELLCRCGLESNGPPEFDDAGRLLRPLHGRIANTPAHHVILSVDEQAGRLTLRGVVDESRFLFQSLRLTASVSTTIGSNELTWSDEVQNVGGREATMQMLYHFNIGHPLLRPGAQILAPVASVAPKTDVAAKAGVERWHTMPPPQPNSAEQVYVCDLTADESGDTRVLVQGLTGEEAVALRFNKRALPCFTVWRNSAAEADGYVLGVEPGTNFPNPRTFEAQHGRVVRLAPGESWSASVSAAWLTDRVLIAEEEKAIGAIQGNRSPDLFAAPRAEWSK